ncbi:MAG: VOC family protein [Caldilineaceae bacterium]|nr:VOC family protein [Caldilineaceae bacterium]
MSSANPPNLIGSAPYFVVSDLAASLDYYCDVLGFTRPRLWGEPPNFAMPDRDGFIFMLKRVKNKEFIQPNRTRGGYWDAYIWVRDAEALYNEFAAKGAEFAYGLTHQDEYNNIEFAVYDPDGYFIAFGQDAGDEE